MSRNNLSTELLTFLRKVRIALTPRNWLLRTRLANGAVVYGTNRAGFGGRGVYLYRDDIEPELRNLEFFLQAGSVFVDVGANTGVYTLKAAKHIGPSGHVVAIEPFPNILATLHESIQKNAFTNVRLRNCCAGKRTSHAQLWMNSGKPNSFSLLKREAGASSFSTLTVTLDDLLSWEGLKRIDYLKIDAEGAEEDVVEGAMGILNSCRPIIQIEVTVRKYKLELTDYLTFRAPRSPNHVYIPKESHTVAIARDLGWHEIT